MSQMPGVTARHWASFNVLQEYGILQSVYSERKTEMQQTGKYHSFILLFASISCKLVEMKFYSNLPEAVKGSLVFQGFSKFS